MTRIVYKIFHLRIRSLIIIQISEGSSVLDQNDKNYHRNLRQPKLKAFQFLAKTNQAERCIQKVDKFETFPQLGYFIFRLNTWERFESFEKRKILKFEANWRKSLGKNVFTHNPDRNTCLKVEDQAKLDDRRILSYLISHPIFRLT